MNMYISETPIVTYFYSENKILNFAGLNSIQHIFRQDTKLLIY